MMFFEVSGVETWWWFPMVTAFTVSFFSATGGLSGAFLLLPFQVSVLGYTGPGVSATNLLFNVLAIPGGVYRYWREKRMLWHLTWTIISGSIPGIFVGAYFRVKYLPDPALFKLFVGAVLLYIGWRLGADALKFGKVAVQDTKSDGNFEAKNPMWTVKNISFEFSGELFVVSTLNMTILCFGVGIISGVYGIGGGAIIVPILIAVYKLPVYVIAGAGLMGTFSASVAGVVIYSLIDKFQSVTLPSAAPDFKLGLLLGIGGFAGIYLGARAQKYLPARAIKIILTILLLFIAVRYVGGYFF